MKWHAGWFLCSTVNMLCGNLNRLLTVLSFFFDHVFLCRNCIIYWHSCSLFIIKNYDFRFIVRSNSLCLHCSFHNTATLHSVPVYTNFCTRPHNCLLYNFPLFPYTCYSAVQHTLYHVSVCTVLLPILDVPLWCVPLSHQTVYCLHLLSVSVCNIFVAWYLVCNAWSCAAIISLPVSPFRSPLDSHNNVSSPSICCLSILIICWPCSTLPSHVSFTYFHDFAFTFECLSFFNRSQLIGLILLQILLAL